jgi:hypothetical protein
MVWKHMAPGKEDVLAPYLRPASPIQPDSGLWNDLVAVPAAHAFAEFFPALTGLAEPGQPTIASLFHYQDKAYRDKAESSHA